MSKKALGEKPEKPWQIRVDKHGSIMFMDSAKHEIAEITGRRPDSIIAGGSVIDNRIGLQIAEGCISCVNAHDDLVATLKWIVANCDGPAFGKAQAVLKKCGEIE
jgi:hypothetical protein